MNITQVCAKLRAQMVLFSGKLSDGLPKVMRRFVAEAVYGIAARGSVRLSEIARALQEEISLKKTIDRLCVRLAYPGLRSHLTEAIIRDASSRVGEDTLLIIDTSEVVKKYAKKMEYLCRVRDGSEGVLADGYWTCDMVGVEVGEAEIVPLYHELYSPLAPGFRSENDEILKAVGVVCRHIGSRGIWVLDRGGDRRSLFYPFLEEGRRFLVRLVGDRNLLYRGRVMRASVLAQGCPLPYEEVVVRQDGARERLYRVSYPPAGRAGGVRRVRLPGRAEELFVVVVKGFGAEPMMLLTNVQIGKGREGLWWVVDAYVTRWKVEETIRFIKQSYDLEDIRVLTYERLRNLAALVLVVAYFTAVHLGLRARLEILARYALRAARRIFGIPDFRYYALADGIREILCRVGKGLWVRNTKDPPLPQLSLF
ncbi:MAG: hypothetical protein JRI46_01450 [Deltaproteobacteria bacterium]|nr:hypothetical protein [Deltaproteobacteria bacterium]